MLGRQTVRPPNAYSAHSRLLSIASLLRICLNEFQEDVPFTSSFSCTCPSHSSPAPRENTHPSIVAPRRLSSKCRSNKDYWDGDFLLTGQPNPEKGNTRQYIGLASRRVGCSRSSHTSGAVKFFQRGYSSDLSNPARQIAPPRSGLNPDRKGPNGGDRARQATNQSALTSPSDDISVRSAQGEDTLLDELPGSSETKSPGGPPLPSDQFKSLWTSNQPSNKPDLPPLVQKLLDLEYEDLSGETAWLLWEQINSKRLTCHVSTNFITRFAGALANAIQDTPWLPSHGEPDPRLQRLDSVLDYLSTPARYLGNSTKIKLASTRVQRALLYDHCSMVDARAELENLLSLKPLGSPVFPAMVLRSIRLIIQAQSSLAEISEMLIDYWDHIHSALIRNVGFTDQSPGAFHEASSLRSVVWKSLSSETNLWLWFSDRFSHWERSRGERLALLLLAFATDRRLASETVNTYDLISKLGVVVPPALLQQAIGVLIENEQFATALTALDADAGNSSQRKTHFRLRMRLAAAMADVNMAESVYKLMSQLQLADHIDQLLLLQADAKHGNVERVVARFNEFFPSPLPKPGPKPNIHHYSAVISAFARAGDEAGASRWIKRMAKSGIPPDTPLYNMILQTFALRNDITSVAGVLKRMHKSGIKRDKRTITILVSMYARRGDPEGAEQVIRSALAIPGFAPDRQLLNSLLSAHVNAASWQGVIRVFDWMVSMKSFNLRPEIDTMNNVLKAYVYMSAPFSTVSRTFEKIKKLGLRPNARSYLMLIQSACDIGNMDAAWNAFNELERTATRQFNPINVYLLTLMMGGYLRNGDKIQARTIYEEMQARGIQPTAVSFRIILSAYSNERTEDSLKAAEHFMASLLESNPRDGEGWRKANTVRGDPVMTIFAPLLLAHGRSLHPLEVEAKFRTMLELGAEPSVESFTLLMDAYRRVGDVDSVTEVWEQLYKLAVMQHHAEIEPTQKSKVPERTTNRRSNVLCIALSIYIDALSHVGRHKDIARAWQTAKEDGFAFDSHNWNHLAIALVHAGEPERAFEVVERVLIPYSQYADRAIRARNRSSPSLLTEHETAATSKQNSETKVVKPRERGRVMRSLVDRGVDSMLEEEATDPTDMVQSLHILHQISPGHNLWVPHERTLIELATAARRLNRGLLVTARSAPHETSDEDVHSDAAYAILDRIKQNSPNALHASLTVLSRVRSYALDDREIGFTSGLNDRTY